MRGGAEACQCLVKLWHPIRAANDRLKPYLPGFEVHVGLKVAHPRTDQRAWSGEDHAITTRGAGFANGGFREPYREVVVP